MMEIKEVAGKLFNKFLFIFFCIMMIVGITFHLMDWGLRVGDVFSIVVMSVLFTGLEFIMFYSKRELSKIELLVRHIIEIVIVIALVLVFDIFLEWGFTSNAYSTVILIGMILAVNIIAIVVQYYWTAKTTLELAKKIKELNDE